MLFSAAGPVHSLLVGFRGLLSNGLKILMLADFILRSSDNMDYQVRYDKAISDVEG